MSKLYVALLFALMFGAQAQAQLGGQQAFSFLLFPSSTRQMALGGYHISSSEKDPSAWLSSPAFLADSIGGRLSAMYGGYYAGINYGTFAYGHAFKGGNLAAGIQYMHTGKLNEYDASGMPLGQFSASQYALSLGYGKQWGVYATGLSIKVLQSGMADYTAGALMIDWGGAFFHPEKDLKIAVAVKNLGFVWKQYAPGQTGQLPLDVQLGISFKPERMPLRFSVTAHHLQRFHIAYEDLADQGKPDALGAPIDNRLSFTDKLARHFAFGGEFVLGKYLRARVGYSLLERKDATLATARGTTGFSWGMALYTRKLNVELSRGNRFIGGGYTAVALSFSPATWVLKRKTID